MKGLLVVESTDVGLESRFRNEYSFFRQQQRHLRKDYVVGRSSISSDISNPRVCT